VTANDRALIALLSMTRYLARAQAAALRWPGREASVARRRLLQLAGIGRARGPGQGRPQRGLFRPPYLRRLWYRRASGECVELWALTRHGEALAAEAAGRPPRVYAGDLSEPVREHWAAMTDLFVSLVVPLMARGVTPAELPIRWDARDSTELPWHQYDMTAGKVRERLMVPDAILEIPGAGRRYLVECEMGSHSIVAASDEKAGATVRKADRYDEFFGGFADVAGKVRFYEQAFPDRWPAEVLFLVCTPSRRASVNAALDRWRTERVRVAVRARAVTVEEASRELGALLGPPLATHAAAVKPSGGRPSWAWPTSKSSDTSTSRPSSSCGRQAARCPRTSGQQRAKPGRASRAATRPTRRADGGRPVARGRAISFRDSARSCSLWWAWTSRSMRQHHDSWTSRPLLAKVHGTHLKLMAPAAYLKR
jgi:hypothetical protein